MEELDSERTRRPVLLVFALTGASGLIYQVIWARQLGLVFGNTTTSISIVLSTFMAGLALGSWAAGKYLVQSGNPLRRYALFEGCIGLYAILFSPLVKTLESLYPALLPDDASVLTLTVCRAIAAFGVLIVPTTLMGATLPLTTEYLHRLKNEHKDWNAGKLYAANTFGAAAGSFFSGFLLIEMVGIQATTLLAASFNLLVMLIGLRLSKDVTAERPAEVAEPAPEKPVLQSPPAHYRYLWLFALTGALALAGEVVWSRALALLLGNSTYAFSAMLIAYLTGIAAGSWLMSGWLKRFTDIRILLPAALIAMTVWYAAAVELVGPIHSMSLPIRALTAPSPSLGISIILYFMSVLALMLPGALLSGALFPVITCLIGGEAGDQGKPIARAYTWNTAGCIAGALIGGFAIAPNFFQFHSILVLSLAAAAMAILAAVLVSGDSLRRSRILVPTIVIAGAVAFWTNLKFGQEDFWLRRFHESYPAYTVPVHRTGLQGVTSIIYIDGQKDQTERSLFNGMGMTAKGITTKAMAHLPIIMHGGADDTLVICFGMGTSFRSALSYGGRVDVVELVPEVFDVFPQFYDDADRFSRNPKARMIVNDGRNFLLLTKKKYDVITVDPPPPIDAAGVNNLYSKEFIELIREHLKPGGVAAHWIPNISQQSGVYDVQTSFALIATFAKVFPHVRMYNEPWGLHLLGSNDPIAFTDNMIDAALANPQVAADLNEFPWDPFNRSIFFREFSFPEKTRKEVLASDPVTDDRPYLEFNLLRNLMGGRWNMMFRVTP